MTFAATHREFPVISGLATALPSSRWRQEDLARAVTERCSAGSKQGDLIRRFFESAGVESRHVVLDINLSAECGGIPESTGGRMEKYQEEAPRLAVRAAAEALRRSGLNPTDVDALITVSCTGFAAPGVDVEVINALGLSCHTTRTHIGFMGCHGAINALRVGAAMLQADAAANVLISCTELCSLHLHAGTDPSAVIANSLFADGSAALTLSKSTQGGRDAWRLAKTGTCLLPKSTGAMTWQIGNRGFEMRLGPEVPAMIEEHLPRWLESWLRSEGLGVQDIGAWAIHPGGPRIVSAVARSLRLAEGATDPSCAVLAEAGNMSSPTVLFILERLMETGAARPCVALAFGPGLTAEAALFV